MFGRPEPGRISCVRERPDAIVVISDALTAIHRKGDLDLAATNRLPAMYEDNRYVNDGGLMSWGTHRRTAHRLLLLMLAMSILAMPPAGQGHQAAKDSRIGVNWCH